MSNEQQYELIQAQKCLKEAREHLDNAMYGFGKMPEDLHKRFRNMYDLICKATDVF